MPSGSWARRPLRNLAAALGAAAARKAGDVVAAAFADPGHSWQAAEQEANDSLPPKSM
jgi:hypothetical protein